MNYVQVQKQASSWFVSFQRHSRGLGGMDSDRQRRIAHEFELPKDIGKPMIQLKPGMSSRIPLAMRQAALDKFYEALVDTQPKDEAVSEAITIEEKVYKACKKKNQYRLAFSTQLLTLKKPQDCRAAKRRSHETANLKYDEISGRIDEFLANEEILRSLSFPSTIHSTPIERLPDQEHDCSRCKRPFTPQLYYQTTEEQEPCFYHHGKLEHVRGHSNRIYSCCHVEAGGAPCTKAPKHVYLLKNYFGDVEIRTSSQWPSHVGQYPLLAMDGEMCHTEGGMEICRLTLVDWDEKRVLDVLIQPKRPIVDYNSRFSGIYEATFQHGAFPTVLPPGLTGPPEGVFTLDELMSQVLPLIVGPETILLGHSLENDLFYLGLDHAKIVDTSIVYPHNKGPPYRRPLRDLTRVYLQQFVQEGSDGHDSYEDCVACLRLLKLKL